MGEFQNEATLASANNTKKKNTYFKNTKKGTNEKNFQKKYETTNEHSPYATPWVQAYYE